MGRHCPSKYEFPNEWMFEDSCIYENVVAIGQPTGYITLIDMNSQKMILELSVFEQQIQAMRRREKFRWNEVRVFAYHRATSDFGDPSTLNSCVKHPIKSLSMVHT